MFKRKIYNDLLTWFKNDNRKPLIIKGARQIGKTTIVKEFGKNNYKHVVYLDFRAQKNLRKIFNTDFQINNLITQITANIPNVEIVPYQTLLIFDEVQDCADARASLKYFKLDGRYDVICTGSLLGIKGYNKRNERSVSVGFEETLIMYPLDFEEFLWANGIKEDTINILKESLDNIKPIPEYIHFLMLDLFKKYICVGGMPEVVNAFVDTGDLNKVLHLQRDILISYQDDFGRHLDENNESFIDKRELTRILACFKSIPSQLSKENKKFQYSKINANTNSNKYEYNSAIEWLEDAGIVSLCYNLSITELPLEGNKIDNIFKVYMQDSGLFIAMLEPGTQADILQGNMLIYKGAIFENIVADSFAKMNRKLYYFHKNSGLEIDFITRYKGKCTAIEVKATNGKTKSLNTLLGEFDKYHVDQAIKLSTNNINQRGMILEIPYYLSFLLTEY